MFSCPSLATRGGESDRRRRGERQGGRDGRKEEGVELELRSSSARTNLTTKKGHLISQAKLIEEEKIRQVHTIIETCYVGSV